MITGPPLVKLVMDERPPIPATAPGDAGKGPPHAGEPTPAPKQGDKNWYGEQNADGVDLSLIRANLRLTVDQRLKRGDMARQNALALMEHARRINPKLARLGR